MPAKRLRKKTKAPDVMSLLMTPEPENDGRPSLTCPSCGRQVDFTAHNCPDCGTVFHEGRGPGHRAPRIKADASSRQVDPDAAEFAERMDKAETWTRVVCTAIGVVFLLVALGGVSYGMGWHSIAPLIFGAFFLARGLGKPGRDSEMLEGLARWCWWGGRWRR